MQNDDVNFKGIVVFLGILAATMVAAYGAITVMSRHLEENARRADENAARQSPPASVAATQPYFPAPREQPNPLVDLQALRASEEAELNSYGWIDKSTGVVRIPIDRAIDLLTQPPKEHP